MRKIENFMFGDVEFNEGEEYFQFKFKFLFVGLISGVVFSGMFILFDRLGANNVGSIHLAATEVHWTSSLFLMLLLRGRKQFFYFVAWSYAVICFFQYVSALLFVPQDELRIVWFFLNVPGVYIVLGQIAGVIVTIATIICIVIVNPYLPTPFSGNAITTVVINLIATSVFFYAYTSRSISFFQRMNELNHLLRHQASRDPLTSLLNARAYYASTDHMIRLALRTHAPFSVLFVDLDHFKSINDQYGHEAGDTVLREVSACLKQSTRDSDILGRIGGEEFSLFLPNTNLADAKLLAEKIRQNIEALMPKIGEISLRVTASIGVASNQAHHRSIADIQRQADEAMYQAKRQGRNRVTGIDILPQPA